MSDVTPTPSIGGTYRRHDRNCVYADGSTTAESGKPIVQPNHYDVSQKVSDIVYENFNADYERRLINVGGVCELANGQDNTPGDKTITQPDILDGWNADYRKYDFECEQVTSWPDYYPAEIQALDLDKIAELQVTQAIYIETDVDISIINYTNIDFEDSPLIPQDYDEPDEFYDHLYLAIEEGAEYGLELEKDRKVLELESGTQINPFI